MDKKTYYFISFRDPKDGKIQQIKARSVKDSNLGLSFVSISDFVFETSKVIIDTKEEELKKKFENTKSFHLSIYSIISIEEVGEDIAALKFEQNKNNLLVLPENNNQPPPQ